MPNGKRDLAYLFLTTALPGERLAELAILTLAQTRGHLASSAKLVSNGIEPRSPHSDTHSFVLW